MEKDTIKKIIGIILIALLLFGAGYLTRNVSYVDREGKQESVGSQRELESLAISQIYYSLKELTAWLEYADNLEGDSLDSMENNLVDMLMKLEALDETASRMGVFLIRNPDATGGYNLNQPLYIVKSIIKGGFTWNGVTISKDFYEDGIISKGEVDFLVELRDNLLLIQTKLEVAGIEEQDVSRETYIDAITDFYEYYGYFNEEALMVEQ